jgi:hypothetical protein
MSVCIPHSHVHFFTPSFFNDFHPHNPFNHFHFAFLTPLLHFYITRGWVLEKMGKREHLRLKIMIKNIINNFYM